MRSTKLALLMAVLSLCPSTDGQTVVRNSARTVRPPQALKESLMLGAVELRLGTAQDVVLATLTRAGYTVTEETGGWTVEEPGKPYHHLGAVGFKKNILTSIDRDWTPDSQSDAVAVVEGIYGALSAAYKDGRSTCSLTTEDQQHPTIDIKSITLICGPSRKSLTIGIVHHEGSSGVTVTESLSAD
jgi:hypothetical protein